MDVPVFASLLNNSNDVTQIVGSYFCETHAEGCHAKLGGLFGCNQAILKNSTDATASSALDWTLLQLSI